MRVFGTLLSLAIAGMLIVAGSAQEKRATDKEKPAGTGGAKEKAKLPKGPAPRFFAVTEIGDDNIKFTELSIRDGRQVIFDYVPTLTETKIYDASGKKITAEQCRKRVKLGTVVLVSADKNMPDPAYLKVVRDDAVILVPDRVLANGEARVGGADTDKGKTKLLDGLWILEDREVGGKEVNVGDDGLFIVDGVATWTNKRGTAPATHTAKIKFDPSKNQKTIDFRFTMGPNIDEKRLGIYKMDGDKLIMAVGDIGGEKRPGKFSSKLAAGATRAAEVLTYKKAKD
jgi:uncharacterized protein (TIGR03067 family)